MNKLLSDLVGPYNGRPILVICGGPSAAEDLKKVPLDWPACVISANQHGFMQDRFKVDFIVSVDYTYASSRQPMREFLAPYQTPSINRWSWADYRIPEWNFNGDSGLTAVAVAVMLGGHAVVVVGLDRYAGAKRYFWHQEAETGWDRRKQPNADNTRVNVKKCVDFCLASEVRVWSGPMRDYWPSPYASLPPWTPCGAPQCKLTGRLYAPLARIFLHPSDPVDGIIRLTEREAKPFLGLNKIVLAQ